MRRRAARDALPVSDVIATQTGARDHIDAVVITTAQSTHRELATQALSHGSHTLVERPFDSVRLAQAGREEAVDTYSDS